VGIVNMYRHRSGVGLFRIQRLSDRRWHVYFADTEVGSHATAPAALHELCSGKTDLPGGINGSAIGLSDDLSDWEAWPPRGREGGGSPR